MKKAIMVHKEWIWSDGLRIVKLSARVETLEKEMAEVKSILERVNKPLENPSPKPTPAATSRNRKSSSSQGR